MRFRTGPPDPCRRDPECRDRSRLWPRAALIAGVVGRCVDDLARQFRSGRALARALGSP